jgi:spore maturation protein CgeB
MPRRPLRLVVIGPPLAAAVDHPHSVTCRRLLVALGGRGHDVLYLEPGPVPRPIRRDVTSPPFGRHVIFAGLDDLHRRCRCEITRADVVVLGSGLGDPAIAPWVLRTAGGVRAYYDLDTPATLAALDRGDAGGDLAHLGGFDLYLGTTGGPSLARIERQTGVGCARPLFASFDARTTCPERAAPRWDLGFLNTGPDAVDEPLERLLLGPARRNPRLKCVVAGEAAGAADWPANVSRSDAVAPHAHWSFFTAQRFTLDLSGPARHRAGFTPGTRLFEAAGCGTPIITDDWHGVAAFFVPGHEIFVARDEEDTLRHLRDLTPGQRQTVGLRARARVLAAHTPRHRAEEFEEYVAEAGARRQLLSA